MSIPADWRLTLSRALSRQARAKVSEILASPPAVTGKARRICFTGAPGAGKSSLLAALAPRRLDRGRTLAILAIDPTSPLSGGSLLGDRVRMDGVADDERVYIRSLASGDSQDGLCNNILGVISAVDDAGFEEIALETVGIGQTSHDARHLVDTFVLVLGPVSGDTIQAMKAGIMELADVYVINKADLAGADKVASEVRALVKWRGSADGWTPPVLLTSIKDDASVAALDEAIEAHQLHQSRRDPEQVAQARRTYQLRSLLQQRLDEITGSQPIDSDDINAAFSAIARQISP